MLLKLLAKGQSTGRGPTRTARYSDDILHADLVAAEAEVRLREKEWCQGGAVTVAESQVEQAYQQAAARENEFKEASAQCRPSLRLRYFRLVRLLALTHLHRYTNRLVAGLCTTVLALLLLLSLLVSFYALGRYFSGALILSSASLGAAAIAIQFLWPTEEKRQVYHRLQQECMDSKVVAEKARAAREHAWAVYEDLHHKWALWNQLEKARKRREDLAALLARVKYQLLHTDWRPMRGTEFEHFLSRVFAALGYHVQVTKRTGDQGADLIVAGKGARIAVQTKGYAGSVGNSAVQEIVAAMAFYRCTSCAVVTNSYFTCAARQLAQANKCRLVDGPQIRDLIEGRIY
jgi:HJR/Mrr/RecB family endonuclease